MLVVYTEHCEPIGDAEGAFSASLQAAYRRLQTYLINIILLVSHSTELEISPRTGLTWWHFAILRAPCPICDAPAPQPSTPARS